VLDLVSGKGSAPAARRLVGLGLLAALPTATAGASDWSDTTGAERRVGLVHAAGAWLSMGLYGASWLARGRGNKGHRRGIVLALAGSGTLAATGYLGGHLTYAYGVGVDTTAFQGGPEKWTPVAPASEVLEGTLKQVRVDDVAVLLTRRGGEFYALADRCSHRGGPLSEGELEGDCVVCPWHGSAFALSDGDVKRGPASLPQPEYDIRVASGQIEIRRTEERSLRSNPI
jgi:nitrite reductase/ring-hydroxylating ferredoxin subunit